VFRFYREVDRYPKIDKNPKFVGKLKAWPNEDEGPRNFIVKGELNKHRTIQLCCGKNLEI